MWLHFLISSQADAPREVTLSVSPWGDIRSGGTATLTCSSDANPPVAHSGYSLYKDGQLISSGQNYIISDILPSDRGWYYCQAWNNISWRGINLINSTEVHLDVRCECVWLLGSYLGAQFDTWSWVQCQTFQRQSSTDWYHNFLTLMIATVCLFAVTMCQKVQSGDTLLKFTVGGSDIKISMLINHFLTFHSEAHICRLTGFTIYWKGKFSKTWLFTS